MTDVVNVEPGESVSPLNLAALSRYLRAQGLELDAGFVPRKFAAGFGNLNFLISIDREKFVLRRPPLGPIPPGANDMAREYRVLSCLHPAFPLVPEAKLFCDNPEVLGAPFLLMEYRPGLVIGATVPSEAARVWHSDIPVGQFLGSNMIDVLAKLHAVDARACGLDTLGKPEGFLERTLRGWSKRAALSWDEDAPKELETVLQWLAGNRVSETKAPTLIHNDFKLDNIILDPETLTPRTLIDWDMGTIGDPLYDLAVLLSYWSEASDPEAMHDLRQMPTAHNGFQTREEAARLYARASGRDLSEFTFYRVLATLRLAVVFQQLYRRHQTGGTDNRSFAGFNTLARGLLNVALQISRGRLF